RVALYLGARLRLHTSDFEGVGIVLVEALASGIPFVSADVGVARELARLWGGSIMARRTPVSIAYHLWHELETERDPDELKAVAASYSWAKVVDQFEDVLV